MAFYPEGYSGTFEVTSNTQTAGTLITGLVPPAGNRDTPKLIHKLVNGVPNWYNSGIPRITGLIYTTAGTAQAVYVLRPLNWALTASAVAINSTAMVLATDPGLYSTAYKYPLPAGAVPGVANNALAANDYVAFQLADGTWKLDKVSSGTYGAIVLTTGTPNVAGATVAAGSPVYFFGAVTDTCPSTGNAHFKIPTVASTSKVNLVPDVIMGGISAFHGGDPLLVISNNLTADGTLDSIFGFYAKN